MDQRTWTKSLTEDLAQWPSRMGPESQLGWTCDSLELDILADGFDPITLKEMDDVALLNRIDTKFLLTNAQLLDVLAALQADYWILSVKGQRLNHYRTLYFDTPQFGLYQLHVNGQAERYKVRSREYTDTHMAFLEVKHKTRKQRTIKERIPTATQLTGLNREAENWLQTVYPFDGHSLEPKLWNTFTRLTLVSKHLCERVTLDVDLSFHATNHSTTLDGLAVAEVKRDADSAASPFLLQMRANHIHPRGFSKYCLGVSMLYDTVKKNALKPKLLMIERLTGGIIL